MLEAFNHFVAVVAPLLFIFPAALYLTLRQPYRFEFEPVEGGSPSRVRERWRQSLIAMGFEELGQRRQRNAPLGTNFTLFVHRSERDLAMATTVGGVEYLEFSSLSASGAMVDTNNAATVAGLYVHRPDKQIAQYPEVRDAEALYTRHKAFRAIVMPEERVVPDDPFEALVHFTTQELDYQIRVGVFQRSGSNVRLTLFGACRFALYAPPPGSWIRRAWRRRKLDRLIRSRSDASR